MSIYTHITHHQHLQWSSPSDNVELLSWMHMLSDLITDHHAQTTARIRPYPYTLPCSAKSLCFWRLQISTGNGLELCEGYLLECPLCFDTGIPNVYGYLSGDRPTVFPRLGSWAISRRDFLDGMRSDKNAGFYETSQPRMADLCFKRWLQRGVLLPIKDLSIALNTNEVNSNDNFRFTRPAGSATAKPYQVNHQGGQALQHGRTIKQAFWFIRFSIALRTVNLYM